MRDVVEELGWHQELVPSGSQTEPLLREQTELVSWFGDLNKFLFKVKQNVPGVAGVQCWTEGKLWYFGF